MVNVNEAQEWHRFKDEGGSTFSGSSSWRRYLEFLEKKLKECGVVDFERNKWMYERWYTSDWPDDSNWGLTSNGKKIRVAHYGAYSGRTGPDGITAKLIQYDFQRPPESIKDKIVVIKSPPHPEPPYSEYYKVRFTFTDYEYATDPETMFPMFEKVLPIKTVSADVWWQIQQLQKIYPILIKGQAAGCIAVFDMPYRRIASLYTFPVPKLYNAPTLYLDRDVGKIVIEDAKNCKKATIRLRSQTEMAETYQLIGYLPGRYYGKKGDEQVLLVTHTDGPCISQENGALGVLGIVSGISRIPQRERERTLLIMLDNRHFTPGQERSNMEYDWFTKHPDKKERIVTYISMEHLGQLDYRETEEGFEPTGLPEISYFWSANNKFLIEVCMNAIRDSQLPRTVLKCVERPGVHGQQQGVWYGLGSPSLYWDLIGCALMGIMGAYWTTNYRLDMFDAQLFCKQVDTMTQVTRELMNVDLKMLNKF
jgi:hypothetical protein